MIWRNSHFPTPELPYFLRSVCSSRSIGRRDASVHHGHWRSGGLKPAETHLFQVLLECTPPCLLWPPHFLLPYYGTQYIAVWASLCVCSLRTWPSVSLLLVVKMSWSRPMPTRVITSSFVAWSLYEMPRIARRQRRWKTSNL